MVKFKATCWCMTINNPMPLKNDGFIDKMFLGYVVGYEHGDDPHRTPHLQCAMIFKSPKTFRQVRVLFPRAHIEPMRDRWKSAGSYCMKDGNWRSFGLYQDEHVTEVGGKGGF